MEYLRSFGLFGLWQLWQSSGPGGRVHFMIAEKSSHVKVKRLSGLAESKAVFQTPANLIPAGGCKELFVHFHSMTQPCFNLALQTMCYLNS